MGIPVTNDIKPYMGDRLAIVAPDRETESGIAEATVDATILAIVGQIEAWIGSGVPESTTWPPVTLLHLGWLVVVQLSSNQKGIPAEEKARRYNSAAKWFREQGRAILLPVECTDEPVAVAVVSGHPVFNALRLL